MRIFLFAICSAALMAFAPVLVFPQRMAPPESARRWTPPPIVSTEEIVQASEEVMAMPELDLDIRLETVRIRAVELDWDIAGAVYEPKDRSRIPVGPDGHKLGAFLIHGGSSDHRFMDDVARLMAGRFGFKVVTMSFPGRYYFGDPGGDWPGDTIHPDGSVRTPLWMRDRTITRDQYDIVEEASLRPKYGTLILACAKEGTEFHHRMAGWPVAFEEGAKELMRRHFPQGEYAIYIHGRSTGGPFSFMLTQRVRNIVGVIGMENSPFGYIFRLQSRPSGNSDGLTYGDAIPFHCLHIRTWRDVARMSGPEALMEEGPEALMRLPMLMEEVMEDWQKQTHYAQFKAEGMVHFGSEDQLSAAATATARRLGLSPERSADLVKQYIGYSRELRGPDVKPVPPIILGISLASADHTPESYKEVTLPMFAAMQPAPRVHLVEFQDGTHFYAEAAPGLPHGVAPAVVQLWHQAILSGYYADYAREWAK
jgi:hypothetical protein